MPELPEVEHLRRSLEPDLIGSRVAAVMVFRSDVVRSRAGASDLAASDLLEGSTVHRLDRRGKQLAIISEGERGVVIQLGMTGQLRWSAGDRSRGGVDHVHVRWRIVTSDSGVRELEFRDPRRFGGISPFASRLDLEGRLWGNLGPDAAEVAFDALADRLLRSARDSRRPLKSMMLDQSVVAGIGNIYADEALFAAAIHPALVARRLDADMAARLAVEIQRTLQAAIDAGGSTLRDYVDSTGRPGSFQRSHQVYGRTGQPCFRCGKAIRSMTLSGRTTAWCPGCQRRSRLSR